MRQIIIKVPAGKGERAMQLAADHEGRNMVMWDGHAQNQSWEVVLVYVGNRRVGPLVNALGEIPEAEINLIPVGTIPMAPPDEKVQDTITEITPRSPMEIWLNGMMSIGSWKGFLGYTIAGSFVVWIAMFTNSAFLLIAAMLIAPYAGPAMNLAIATATGDWTLLYRNLIRYFVSLGLTILITAAVSFILQQQVATNFMVDVSQVPAVVVLLPLVAGAAGAINLINSDNNSLVSGTAAGVLVAASLAPPAALVGMASAIGRWDMTVNGIFLLVIQLIGINLAGSLIFRFYGELKPSGARYQHGKNWIAWVSFVVTLVILAGMIFWQFSDPPNLQRQTRAQNAVSVVQTVVDESEVASLVEANMRFTRPEQADQNTLLGIIYVERLPGVNMDQEEISALLQQNIQQGLLERDFNVIPLIHVTVLESLE
jgi:uncharacterized hydrophobic protein (TIGR00271 family)/prepilin-type processing-associated H-X9-DG protein